MEENQNQESAKEDKPSHYIRLKKFQFVMLLFLLVFTSAAVTMFALSFGDEKAVNVGTKEREEFNKLYEAYDKLKANYYKKIDDEKLMNGAINGMIDSLQDPYSDYMDKEEAAKFNESITSSFEGIGAEIQEQNGSIVIVSPIKGSPAEKAGLKPNDKVLAVDGKSLHGKTSSEAVLLIRGEKGTKVSLKIQRFGADEPTEITIVRDKIPIETVYTEMMDHGVAKIQITSFSENTAKELREAITKMEKEGMKSLVLDLRQNPGGLLDQALEMTNMFVPEGKVILQIEDKNGKKEQYVSDNKDKVKVPVAVVIDNGSASASEILAAALKEAAGIPVIGEKSFGKGTVQTAEQFLDKSNMKITTAKWLTPNGNWIHKKGIKPDYEVKLPPYAELPFINPDKEMKENDLSNEVKSAEQMLDALGYHVGKVDGYFDDNTKSAVIKFQQDEELEVNGEIKGETTVQLMTKLRDKIEENDTQIKKAVEVMSKKQK